MEIETFPFHVERWQRGFAAPYETIAIAVNQLVARGALNEAARLYPDDWLMLRHGARVLERRQPITKSEDRSADTSQS